MLVTFGWFNKAGGFNEEDVPVEKTGKAMNNAWVTRGADFGQNGNKKSYELNGRMMVFEKERTIGSVVLPMVLKKLFPVAWDIPDDETVDYSIYNVTKFSYVLFIPDFCGWNVLVKVNMDADHDLLRSRMQFDTDSVYTQMPYSKSCGFTVTRLAYVNNLCMYFTDLSTSATSELLDEGVLNEENLKGMTAYVFRTYMCALGTKAERDRLEKLYNNALKQLSMDDAAKVVGIFKRAWAGDGGADRKTQVLINSGKGVVLTPLYPGLDIDLEDVEAQAAFVRCAFRAICGFWKYLVKEYNSKEYKSLGSYDYTIIKELKDAKLSGWGKKSIADKPKPNYENLANMMANTDPLLWATMYINTQRSEDDKEDARIYIYHLILGKCDKESIIPEPLYGLHTKWHLIIQTALARCTHLQIASESESDAVGNYAWDHLKFLVK